MAGIIAGLCSNFLVQGAEPSFDGLDTPKLSRPQERTPYLVTRISMRQ
jgi:hypothetical protein